MKKAKMRLSAGKEGCLEAVAESRDLAQGTQVKCSQTVTLGGRSGGGLARAVEGHV